MKNIMAKKKNRNDYFLKSIDDLKDEISYQDFEYKEHFLHLCNLIPNIDKEKIEVETVNKDKVKIAGLVYVFVISGRIFKIGHSITPIAKRVQSYNCGKLRYRIAGTNSTTNYFVLQSLLKINEIVNVYAFFPEHPKYTLFGKEYQDSFPSSKRAEKEILQDFLVKHKKKPIGCTQT
jgi:hypothetical protein